MTIEKFFNILCNGYKAAEEDYRNNTDSKINQAYYLGKLTAYESMLEFACQIEELQKIRDNN